MRRGLSLSAAPDQGLGTSVASEPNTEIVVLWSAPGRSPQTTVGRATLRAGDRSEIKAACDEEIYFITPAGIFPPALLVHCGPKQSR
jgi:hypothetical protein